MLFSRSAIFLLVIYGCPLLISSASAAPWIDMGPKDQLAATQPQARIEVFTNDGATSFGPGGGEDIFGTTNTLLVDTGASSIFLMNDAASQVEQNGYIVENQILEQGVSGFTLVDVSAPYQVRITGDDGVTFTLDNQRLLSAQLPDLFGVNGIIGMTSMVGRVMSMELKFVIDPDDILNFELPETRFYNDLPASTGHRYSIPLVAKRFDAEGDPPLPSSAPLAMLQVEAGVDGLTSSGAYVLDTGASISFISSEIATNLGLDTNGDGEFNASDERFFDSFPVGGVGGTIEAPMFSIDTFRVATNENVDLVWDEVQVLVIDIHPEIDGIFGADVVTSGLLDLIGLGDGEGEGGPVEFAHFDFRQFYEEGDAGNLVLDLNAAFDVVINEPLLVGDYNGNGAVDAADFAVWRDSLGATGAGLAADGDGSLTIDEGDYVVWRNNFGNTLPLAGSAGTASNVPEPTALMLLVCCALAITPRARFVTSTKPQSTCSW